MQMPHGASRLTGMERIFRNSRYQVWVREFKKDAEEGDAGMMHLSIKRNDKAPLHDWRDLQRIKNELCGAEREAIELYPAESRLVDSANQYHLWVLPEGEHVPVGFRERLVIDKDKLGLFPGAVQRPFED